MSDNNYGGYLVAEALVKHGVKFLFTLCGGHISPILIAAKRRDIRVIDVRDEVTAVFAADAVSRLSGVPGVAAVTAGPGLTNTITAVKNAQLAQSPLILLGGATATMLKGRGSLQDIDQMALLKPHVKWATGIKSVKEILPTLERAFAIARSGVPGPVFIEFPVDLLYMEELVREWYGVKAPKKGLKNAAIQKYLTSHLNRMFSGAWDRTTSMSHPIHFPRPNSPQVKKVIEALHKSKRPVMLVGSQAMAIPSEVDSLQKAVKSLGIPVYLSGMARGLLGADCLQLMRHKRRMALRESDLVLLAGVPCDFRLDYGRHIPGKAYYISINRSKVDLKKNRRPNLAVLSDAGQFLEMLAQSWQPPADKWAEWLDVLQERDQARDSEIQEQAKEEVEQINPIELCQHIGKSLNEKSLIVADGGDFVATASYVFRPNPLSWLDPGVFGTLGVGAGFALGAKLCRPDAEVWIIYGDGSVGYSLCEWDTFVRHNVPVIAVVGNDACWQQIAREQVEIFQDDVGTVLAHSDYHKVVQGFGAEGIVIDKQKQVGGAIEKARTAAQKGKPVMINAIIGKTNFRKGSISM